MGNGDPVGSLDGGGDRIVAAVGTVAFCPDAVVANPQGKVGVGSAVGGAGDPEAAAADAGAGQRSEVVEDGMRGFGMG